ncbi:flagellar hook-associated protein FlgK [Stakelama tenebrarum]|uniref:Flagellar hook-associated protein 1 n=1 Tax=Stakelama tenebrarum TaxID=2711215 RepID=A0A6G6Y1B5_9SPHN|nr:flagellar hook-associated protein FlgK [Sphingosinithalassobacter tenebrarum]QIG78700.1 flagellar hook-associated protein FlgK [Sphingosinithalassobacter tenebrarum]
MSDLLSIGASGIRAYQSAIATTSDNIANAGNEGYTRRTTEMREVVTTSSLRSNGGSGVVVTGVSRMGDDARADAVRSASADLARTETSATWLGRIENALNDNGLSDQLTAFFNSAKSVAADPSATAPRAIMLESAASLASAFTATSKALDGAASDLDASAEAAVSQLNQLAAGLAKVNAGLSRAPANSAGQATLLDQRDGLLEQMSALTDVTVTLDDFGRANVLAGGRDGPMLVQGDTHGAVTYLRNEEGAVSLAVHGKDGTRTMMASGGTLGGAIEGAQRIANARTELDAIAAAVVDGVNDVQAQGEGLDGRPGAPIFAAGDPPAELSLVLSDPRGIAAALPGGGSRDNGNLANLESLRGTSNVEGRLGDAITANATALTARRTVADAQTAIRDTAVASRDSLSGVNLDEEAVDLMRFQQAYQASSRIIQVARETLQSILNIQ